MAEDPRTLHIHQHFTYRVTFSWQDETGAAVSLAGYQGTFSVLSKPGVLPPLLELDSPTGVSIQPGGATGEVAVVLTADQTAALPLKGAYALSVSPNAGAEPIEYVASGPFVALKIGA